MSKMIKVDEEELHHNEFILKLKEMQSKIRYSWPESLNDSFNPIELSLLLLDDTSIGLAHRFSEFKETKIQLENILREIVNENYELFSNSIGSYHKLLFYLSESQIQASEIKSMLGSNNEYQDSNENLIKDLKSLSLNYKELIDVLNFICEMTSIIEKIDELISTKQISLAHKCISDQYKKAENYQSYDIPSLNSFIISLDKKKENLYNFILSEIQSEIFLKKNTLNSEDNESNIFIWNNIIKSNIPGLKTLKKLISELKCLDSFLYNSLNLDVVEIVDVFMSTFDKYFQKNHEKKNQLVSETNCFDYIYSLVKTSFEMNKFNDILQIIVENFESEFHSLIKKCINDVKSDKTKEINDLMKLKNIDINPTFGLIDISLTDMSIKILQNFFGSLFLNCFFMLQRIKFIENVYKQFNSETVIINNSHDRSGKVNIFLDFWKIVKNGIKEIIIVYIDENDTIYPNLLKNSLDIQSDKFDKLMNQNCFSISNFSQKNKTEISENLEGVLKRLMPGILKKDLKDYDSVYIKNDNFIFSLENLVPKNIFNMKIIMEYFFIFIEGCRRLFLNTSFKDFDSDKNKILPLNFFNNFMKKNFIKYLQIHLNNIFQNLIGGNLQNKIFQNSITKILLFNNDLILIDFENTNSDLLKTGFKFFKSKTKIFQNAFDFKIFFFNLTIILNISLNYKKRYIDIVLNLLNEFYILYNNNFNNLLPIKNNEINFYFNKHRSDFNLINEFKTLKNEFATNTDESEDNINKIIDNITSFLVDNEIENIINKKNELYNLINNNFFLEKNRIIIACCLFLTISWILSWLNPLNEEQCYTIGNGDNDGLHYNLHKIKHEWSFLCNYKFDLIFRPNYNFVGQKICLLLIPEKFLKYDQIIESFEILRIKILLVLRHDLLCYFIFQINKLFEHINEKFESDKNKSDFCIGSLYNDVLQFYNLIDTQSLGRYSQFVFSGISNFLVKFLICKSFVIKKINLDGIKFILEKTNHIKQLLNVLGLEKNSSIFEKCKSYFELFYQIENDFQNSNQIKYKYSSLECENITRLFFSQFNTSSTQTPFQSKWRYNEVLKKVKSYYQEI